MEMPCLSTLTVNGTFTGRHQGQKVLTPNVNRSVFQGNQRTHNVSTMPHDPFLERVPVDIRCPRLQGRMLLTASVDEALVQLAGTT